ncbi:MAG: Uma2 family endonuclease [Lewinellaceae bacterium]|nr:Uma2 family endonuclease [Lewinellaceae bacterium]
MSFDQFVELSLRFPDLRIEQEPNGQITIMPPVFSGSGYREGEAFGLVWQWNRQTRLGKTFSPSTGVHLRDGSTKQADTIWISNEKINSIDPARLDAAFLPLEPDFVIEIRSKTDDLDKLKSKMTDSWIANGVRLAWLIDPYEEKAWVYRSNGSVDVTESFDEKKLSGEEVLPGFELDLAAFKIV